MDFNLNSPKMVFVFGLALGIAAASVVFFIYRPAATQPTQEILMQPQAIEKVNCAVTEADKTVRGVSLGNLVKDGSKIKALENYYACNAAVRGDIVEYQSGASATPLVKVVKGVPGDTFDLKKVDAGWNMLLNGAALKNSEGKPYVLNEQSYRILSLYVHDYRGVIPQDAYLIMGELPGGSLDSSRFGLVGRSDFLGKVSL